MQASSSTPNLQKNGPDFVTLQKDCAFPRSELLQISLYAVALTFIDNKNIYLNKEDQQQTRRLHSLESISVPT